MPYWGLDPTLSRGLLLVLALLPSARRAGTRSLLLLHCWFGPVEPPQLRIALLHLTLQQANLILVLVVQPPEKFVQVSHLLGNPLLHLLIADAQVLDDGLNDDFLLRAIPE